MGELSAVPHPATKCVIPLRELSLFFSISERMPWAEDAMQTIPATPSRSVLNVLHKLTVVQIKDTRPEKNHAAGCSTAVSIRTQHA